jgi:hypothetical protein
MEHLVNTKDLAERLGRIADTVAFWGETFGGADAGADLLGVEKQLREIIAEVQPKGTDDPNVIPFHKD